MCTDSCVSAPLKAIQDTLQVDFQIPLFKKAVK